MQKNYTGAQRACDICEAPYEEFFGDCFGFQVWSGTESIVVDFDNLSIKTY